MMLRWRTRSSELAGRAARRLAVQVLRLLPMDACRRFVPRPLIAFCYHVVSDRALPHVRHLYSYKSPRQFARDLDYVQDHFDVIGYDAALESARAGRARRRVAALLTFDDGMSECFSIVRPMLLARGLPCVFFVTPPVIDNKELFHFNKASLCVEALLQRGADDAKAILGSFEELAGRRLVDVRTFQGWISRWIRTRPAGRDGALDAICERLDVDVDRYLATVHPYMTTAEVQSLHADGFVIGAHGMRHTALGALARREEMEREIVESCRAVSALTGAASVPFAFPFDGAGVDRCWLSGVAARHVEVGMFFDSGRLKRDSESVVNRVIADRPPLILPDRSNLSGLLRDAYLDEMTRPLRRASKRLGVSLLRPQPARSHVEIGPT